MRDKIFDKFIAEIIVNYLNKLFKGFVGTTKDITRIGLVDGKSLSIFEGFFDCLVFLSHYKITEFQNSATILNSISLRKHTLAEIEQFNFSKVYLFLDNDIVGDDCKQFFKTYTDSDKSFLYEGYKDFNEWKTTYKLSYHLAQSLLTKVRND